MPCKALAHTYKYAPTKEVSRILPIPDEIRFKSAMQPMMPEPPEKKGHWYLALHQGTKYAVMSIHTVAEKQLFSKLMQEHKHLIRKTKILTGIRL